MTIAMILTNLYLNKTVIQTKPAEEHHQCITVRQLTARYPFVHSSALFLCISFAYFTLTLFSCWIYSRVSSCCTPFKSLFLCVALISSCTFSVLHFFILCYFQVSRFFRVVHISCCTFPSCNFFILHYFWVSRFSCCTFSRVALFPCCPLFMSHLFPSFCFHVVPFVQSFYVALFRVAVFSCYTFSMLNSFHVALYSCCTIFMLQFFVCCTCFMLNLFSWCFMLHFLGIQTSNLIKKRLHHRYFLVKFLKFWRTSANDYF